jgi:hypothetical protein
MGERDFALEKHEARGWDPMQVDTFGGRLDVEWDADSKATPIGQLAFFAEFLKNAGVFDDWVGECPLSYTSPNAPTNRDILGTWMLSVLAGQIIGSLHRPELPLWERRNHLQYSS